MSEVSIEIAASAFGLLAMTNFLSLVLPLASFVFPPFTILCSSLKAETLKFSGWLRQFEHRTSIFQKMF